MSIGENIKHIRIEKSITQKELGERLGGISQQQIGQWETGKANPKIETIQKIADALGVDPFSLYSFEMASDALEKGMNLKENKLLDNYRLLNDNGQDKAVEQVELLTKIPEYQKEPKG